MHSNEVEKPTLGQISKLSALADKGKKSRDLYQAMIEGRLREFLRRGPTHEIEVAPHSEIKSLEHVFSDSLKSMQHGRWLALGHPSNEDTRFAPLNIERRYQDLKSVVSEQSRPVYRLKAHVVELPREMCASEIALWHADREESPATLRELIHFGSQYTNLLKKEGGVGAAGEWLHYDMGFRMPYVYGYDDGSYSCEVTEERAILPKGTRLLAVEL